MLDSQHMLQSIDLLSRQVEHAWREASQVTITPGKYDQVVLFGMGGSALGLDLIRGVFADRCTVPLLIESNYTVPAYVNDRTLVILSSYSGTTEETLAIAKVIAQRTKHILVITTGGDLAALAKAQQYPVYQITPMHNPCGQPRIAVGYAAAGVLGLLRQAGVLEVSDAEMDDVSHYLDGNRQLLHDAAFDLAATLDNVMPLFVASEFLLGNAHAVSNQVNENGKNFAMYFAIPELNHHLLEGLAHPTLNPQLLHFILIESHLYHERVQRRYVVTQQVLDKNNIKHTSFVATANTKLLQAFEILQWGSYLSFALAMRNQVDPSPIPWVDFFKHALK